MSTPPPSTAQVEQWFHQAASGVDAGPLQAWMNACSSPGPLRSAAFETCLSLLQYSADLTIRFYALGALSRMPYWSAAECTVLRQALMADPCVNASPAYYRNKVAACLQQVYWQQTFDVTTWPLQQPAAFLKWTQMVWQSMASGGSSGDEAAKESLKQQRWACLQIVLHILQQSLSTTTTTSSSSETLTVLSLEAIQAFLAWTAWTLVLHNSTASQSSSSTAATTLVQCLCSCTMAHQPTSIQMAALETWQEWTHSAAQEDEYDENPIQTQDQNIHILTALTQHIHQADFLPYQGESKAEIEVVIAAAKLVDTMLQAVVIDNRKESHQQLFQKVLDLFFRAYAYEDIDVSAAVLPLAKRIVETKHLSEHWPRILQILHRQMCFDDDFDYDFADDIGAEEEMYRVELDKLYLRLVQNAPNLVLQFLPQALQHSGNNARHLEAVLRLVRDYCEGIKPPPGVKTVMQSADFVQLLVTIQQSSLNGSSTNAILHSNQHFEVLRLYYETAVRYYPLYQISQYQDLLGPLLSALTGTLGLQHSHAPLRSRCCFLLLRLVKAVVALLAPFVSSAVSGIMGLLSNPALELQPDDTLYLFESIGLLLGRTGLSAHDQQSYLAQVMTPHIQAMEQILGQLSDKTAMDMHDPVVEQAGESLSRSIAAITYLSKGFKKQPPQPVQIVLIETLPVTLNVLRALPMSEPVRSKSMTFLQRMIQCLDGDRRILPFIPQFLSPLIQHCTVDDVLFVSQIFNQVSLKYKNEAVGALDASFVPFWHKCRSLVPATDDIVSSNHIGSTFDDGDVPPHLVTEQMGIQKLAFSVVEHFVCNQVTSLLQSPTNVSSLESVLGTTAQAAIYATGPPVVRKTCLHIFRELWDQWHTHNDAYKSGLRNILYQQLLPGVLSAFGSDAFNAKDAQQNRNVVEFAKLLFALHATSETEALLHCLYTIVPLGSLDNIRTATEVKSVENLLLDLLTK